jgi:hypothetical protein
VIEPAALVQVTDSGGTTARVEWFDGEFTGSCSFSYEETNHVFYEQTGCMGQFCCGGQSVCTANLNHEWDQGTCTCWITPLVVALNGNWQGIMSSARRGPLFRLSPTLERLHVAWPVAQQNVGWLVRDRNGNGQIDDGSELYGSATPQPTPSGEPRHGFVALTADDSNGDGLISADDQAFESMAVWFDRNHDGEGGPSEVHSLSSLGIKSISVRYRIFGQVDASGNTFLYDSAGVQQVKNRVTSFRVYDVVPRTAIAVSTSRSQR